MYESIVDVMYVGFCHDRNFAYFLCKLLYFCVPLVSLSSKIDVHDVHAPRLAIHADLESYPQTSTRRTYVEVAKKQQVS